MTDRPTVAQLRNLADRADRGRLTAAETALLRAGIEQLARVQRIAMHTLDQDERLDRAETFVTTVADIIANHEGDEWAAHSATTAIRRGFASVPHAVGNPELRRQLAAAIQALGTSEAAIARVRKACASVTAADQGHNPAVGWVVMRVLEAIDARLVHGGEQPAPRPDTTTTEAAGHIYLSTGCYHNDHAYCQNMTGLNGAKRPARCKFCSAPCQCSCHAEADDTDQAEPFIDWPFQSHRPAPTNPAAAVEVRDPCPHCEDCRLIPRTLMAQHQRDAHPETLNEAGPAAIQAADLPHGTPITRSVVEEALRQGVANDAVCDAYQPPSSPAESGVCARCGMYDYKHQAAAVQPKGQ